MTPILLGDFVGPLGQAEAAKKLGSSQVAISKALKADRLILVSTDPSGAVSSFEIKVFPGGGSRDKARLDLEEIVSQMTKFGQSGAPAVNPSSAGGA
ncbi:Cro/CI family transcriptional regulator [Pseudomonas sp. MRSN 12121]|uniref:Cro/CI family transcriptional regulator n=1 Tax=Pseudomonas sp. MRSN 12121 TaxID=1611770 RepID=UPI0009E50337|nr:Cro/CI family transcriptional regulator [Pseudomonas sp. MRSN 12121]